MVPFGDGKMRNGYFQSVTTTARNMIEIRMSWVFNVCLLSAAIFLSGHSNHGKEPINKRYSLEEDSRWYISGSSNVNKFTCFCEDRPPNQFVELDRNGGHTRFKKANLSLRTKFFDCRNRKIDADMQKALKAETYPYIHVNLLDCWHDLKYSNGQHTDWFEVQAKVGLTITNVTKETSIMAKAKVLGSNRFQLKGEKALQMSAFGIVPPEALFGMIKVDDWITFHFDLTVQVEDVQQ
jgi:YceI-like domain